MNKFYKVLLVFLLIFSAIKWIENYKYEKHQTEYLLTAKELNKEEFDRIRKDFLAVVVKRDPKVALEKLRERIKKDNRLLRSCHALVHDIGHEAYEKYGDFGEAIKYQDEICNSGYLHGIIENYFSKSKDVFATMKIVCNKYRLSSLLSWECYHGVGHGVMYYTANNLPRSLEMCESLDSNFANVNCVNGVFMENFNTDQKLHPSKFLKQDDLFYPCQEQAAKYKGDCYLYAPTHYLSLNKNDYTGALSWCDGSESNYRLTCVGGVGSQAIKENINNPKFVEKICMKGDSKETAACIGGMIGLYINHYGSLEPARKLCEQLEDSNRQTCNSSVQASSGLFE